MWKGVERRNLEVQLEDEMTSGEMCWKQTFTELGKMSGGVIPLLPILQEPSVKADLTL